MPSIIDIRPPYYTGSNILSETAANTMLPVHASLHYARQVAQPLGTSAVFFLSNNYLLILEGNINKTRKQYDFVFPWIAAYQLIEIGISVPYFFSSFFWVRG